MSDILILLISLIFIVISSNLFCNALEHLGEKLGISEGVTGSIFAAVGTALPETMIPILAVLTMHGENSNNEISIGAILGAPLMLSTLSLFVMALSILKQRGLSGLVRPEQRGLGRDLKFFILGYTLTTISIFCQNIPGHQLINSMIILALGLCYFVYLLLTIKDSLRQVMAGHNTVAADKLFLEKLGLKVNFISIISQLFLGLCILVYFAEQFIGAVNHIVLIYKISAFVIALIIIPIATEMPEKINSILWIRKGRDTLAIGNITGAMVFQGTLLPMFGIAFTKWQLTNVSHLIGIFLTFIATLWFLYNSTWGKIKVWHFFVNGALYFINLVICAYFFVG